MNEIIKSFSTIVEPNNDSTWSWTIEQQIRSNEYKIMNKEKWTKSPVEILSPI